MFGQNNEDDQDTANSQDPSMATFSMPAPGSPAGPVSQDDTHPSSDVTSSKVSMDTALPDDLLNIKQEALQELTPLVGHLEQTPEEKFRTTMMMIQAADDHSLVKTAYEAAKSIEDEKTRAQALLDVVNEINYFTQHHDK